jgi:hypothetical protein
MKTVGNIAGAILLGVGGIWCGQGAGYIRDSFMTDDKKWLIIGAVVACLGAGLLIWTNSRDDLA